MKTTGLKQGINVYIVYIGINQTRVKVISSAGKEVIRQSAAIWLNTPENDITIMKLN